MAEDFSRYRIVVHHGAGHRDSRWFARVQRRPRWWPFWVDVYDDYGRVHSLHVTNAGQAALNAWAVFNQEEPDDFGDLLSTRRRPPSRQTMIYRITSEGDVNPIPEEVHR